MKIFSDTIAWNELSVESGIGVTGWPRWRNGLCFVLLALLVFLLYSNTLDGTFVFDTEKIIQYNPAIRLTELSLDSLGRAGFQSPISDRPVATISFGLNYFFNEYNVGGYRLVNILIHFTNGFLLYLLFKTTLNLPLLRDRYGSLGWLPFVTALVWLVHPLHTQSVTYIIQRMNSLAAMFYLSSLLMYVKARLAASNRKRWLLLAGCACCVVLGLGSKEIAVTIPLFIFLYEWYFLQDLSLAWLKSRLPALVGMALLLGVVALVFLGGSPVERILSHYDRFDFTMGQRVLTEFRVVIFYLSLLLFPHPSRLNLLHDFSLSTTIFSPIVTMAAILALVGLAGLAIGVAKGHRLVSFCILWFLGNLLLESSIFGIEIVFEHRTYLPSMLLVLLMVIMVHNFLKHQRLQIFLLCVVVFFSSLWTYERNSLWADEVAFWSDGVKKSPDLLATHNFLGIALDEQGRHEEAVAQFQEVLRIDPDYWLTHNNLGLSLASLGRYKEAFVHYSEALRLNPNYAQAQNNLMQAMASVGNTKEAYRLYSEALRQRPDYLERQGYYTISQAKAEGMDASSFFQKNLRVKPDYKSVKTELPIMPERKS